MLEVVALARVEAAGGHAGDTIEVARRAAARAGLALALEADLGAVLHPGRDLDLDLRARGRAAGAVAGRAGVVDDRAVAAAPRAGLAEGEAAQVAADARRGPCTRGTGAGWCPAWRRCRRRSRRPPASRRTTGTWAPAIAWSNERLTSTSTSRAAPAASPAAAGAARAPRRRRAEDRAEAGRRSRRSRRRPRRRPRRPPAPPFGRDARRTAAARRTPCASRGPTSTSWAWEISLKRSSAFGSSGLASGWCRGPACGRPS